MDKINLLKYMMHHPKELNRRLIAIAKQNSELSMINEIDTKGKGILEFIKDKEPITYEPFGSERLLEILDDAFEQAAKDFREESAFTITTGAIGYIVWTLAANDIPTHGIYTTTRIQPSVTIVNLFTKYGIWKLHIKHGKLYVYKGTILQRESDRCDDKFINYLKTLKQRVMNKYCITFGQGHIHRHNGHTLDKDCVGVINANTEEEARKLAFKWFGNKFAAAYTEEHMKENIHYFPRGYIDLN